MKKILAKIKKNSIKANLNPRKKFRLFSLGIIIVAFIAASFDYTPYYNTANSWLKNSVGLSFPKIPDYPFRLGLDLQGGAHLVYTANMSEIPDSDRSDAIEGVRDVIERRVNSFGVSEPVVQTTKNGDNYRLVVELAGVHDVNLAITQIGETPILEFKETNTEPARDLTEEERKEMEDYNTKALEKAQDLIKQLEEGVDFSELARNNSEDQASAINGGDLGFARRGLFVSEFEKALFDDLAVGEFTKEPVKTQFGYHIIKKEEVRGGIQPDGTDNTEARASHILVLTKSEINYVGPTEPWKSTELGGRELERSRVEFDQNTGAPQILLVFDDRGKELFAEISRRNVKKQVAIFLDGEILSAPVVQEEIRDGRAVITGDFNLKEAKLLAQRLNAGALPVPIELTSQNTVGATLGKDSLNKSLKAGLIGLIALAAFMILIYRIWGLVAVFALTVYATVTLGVFKMFGITMTLSGIAGFILSLGMAVDANVLIFERMREEKKLGKKGFALVEDGFARAWPSIRDGNISTLITCLILIWFSTSMVKGFAITLGIGVILSMLSAVLVTKVFLKSLK